MAQRKPLLHEEDGSKNSIYTCVKLPCHAVYACMAVPGRRLLDTLGSLCISSEAQAHYLQQYKPHLKVEMPRRNQATYIHFDGTNFEHFMLSWNVDTADHVHRVIEESDHLRDASNNTSSKTIVYETLVRLMYTISNNIIVNLSLFRMVADTKVPTVILPFQSVLRSTHFLSVREVDNVMQDSSSPFSPRLASPPRYETSSSFACCSSYSETREVSHIKCDFIWPRARTPEVSRCAPFTGCCHLSHVSTKKLFPFDDPEVLAAELDLEAGLIGSLSPLKQLIHNERVILYLHGGAYVLCNTRSHRSLIYSICKETNSVVFAPNFRRPPEVDLQVTIDDALQSYLFLVNELGVSAQRITVMGESAGGALCISLLCRLKELQDEAEEEYGEILDGLQLQPKNAVVISPWVDLSANEATSGSFVSNNHHHRDMFSAEVVKRFANRISQGRSATDPIVSPIYNDLSGLPPMLVIAGESELLRDQIVDFARRAKEADESNQVTLHVYHEMCHAFLLFEFCHPTAKRALQEICRFLESELA